MTTIRLSHRAPYTVSDLFEIEDETNRYEVVDGSLLVSPLWSVRHQIAADRTRTLLDDAAPAGVHALSAVVVRCGDDTTALRPDVTVTTADLETTAPFLDAGDVLAVVEIASPASRRSDRTIRPQVYTDAGIGVLWRTELEPFGKINEFMVPMVMAYQLTERRYTPVGQITAGITDSLPVPYPVKFNPATLVGPPPT